MLRNVNVKYKGIELTCSGYYTPYKSYGRENPPDEESFEIHCVCYGETEITPLLDVLNFDWAELETICIEELQ